MTYDELMTAYKNLQIKYDNKVIELNNKILELNSLKRYIFGSKREKTPKNESIDIGQCSLFDDEKEIEQNVQEQIVEQVEEITVYRKKKSKKKVAGIKKSHLKDVVIKRQEYVLNEEEKCPECNNDVQLVGKEVVRQEIGFVPATLEIKEYVQYIYKCKKCGTNESEKETPTFIKSAVPKSLLPHSFASASLASEVIYQKYYLGVPLYRQEKLWDERGLILPRSMMAHWCIKLNEYYLEPLWKLMLKKLKEKCELLHGDETTLQVNKEPNKKATTNSYMWILRAGELEKTKGVIFKYSPSRSGKTAEEFIEGYTGILVTDGYAGYNNIKEITHAECWSHCRRYFYESVPLLQNKKMDTTADGYTGVSYCDELFKIEEEIAELSVDEKQKIRQERSKPILDDFFTWVNDTLTNKIVVNNKLKKALTYAQNQKKELSEFINDGRIPLSNNAVERSIRPFAVHRKNWLFADTQGGANANATMYSIIESAKANNLKIYKYINYLLEELPQIENIYDAEELEKYLPWSEELPDEIKNFEGTYEEPKLA